MRALEPAGLRGRLCEPDEIDRIGRRAAPVESGLGLHSAANFVIGSGGTIKALSDVVVVQDPAALDEIEGISTVRSRSL